jgi:hypothetical protein
VQEGKSYIQQRWRGLLCKCENFASGEKQDKMDKTSGGVRLKVTSHTRVTSNIKTYAGGGLYYT